MIPATFEYERAESAEHALQLLGQHGEDAKLLAGGQSLLALMKLRLARPTALVDIGRLSELSYVRDAGDSLAIGALITHEELARNADARRDAPLVAKAAGEVGDPQVRHMGTIGGSVAHGDPASDLPSALVALDAQFVLRGSGGERTVAAREFFRGVFETALGPDELLTEIRVPKHGDAGWSYVKFHPRAQDWAIVGVAAVVRNGGTPRAAVSLTNMGSTPIRAESVERAFAAGGDPAGAAESAAEGTNPVSDPFASAEYRRYLAPILVRRALEEALSR